MVDLGWGCGGAVVHQTPVQMSSALAQGLIPLFGLTQDSAAAAAVFIRCEEQVRACVRVCVNLHLCVFVRACVDVSRQV